MTTGFNPWADEGVEVPPKSDGPSGLLAIELDDALRAQEALLASLRLHQRQAIRIEDAAIVSKDAGGRIRIHQTRDVGPAQGAMTGTWLGMLAGLIFMVPLVGAALGAAVGGIWAKLRDIGISDRRDAGDGRAPRAGGRRPLPAVRAAGLARPWCGRCTASTARCCVPPWRMDLTTEIAAALEEVV